MFMCFICAHPTGIPVICFKSRIPKPCLDLMEPQPLDQIKYNNFLVNLFSLGNGYVGIRVQRSRNSVCLKVLGIVRGSGP